ncbi:AIP3-domain-containing protein [Violaceomyces palustris]|uniref:AIP3-domain-containing protein n=1 Tax=Violaceomyces palustris TaxID=1673888 RepID=A0ACD0NR73_9BASI|nr:AIP3-domain-containing protein [Violaceomyces palustris]
MFQSISGIVGRKTSTERLTSPLQRSGSINAAQNSSTSKPTVGSINSNSNSNSNSANSSSLTIDKIRHPHLPPLATSPIDLNGSASFSSINRHDSTGSSSSHQGSAANWTSRTNQSLNQPAMQRPPPQLPEEMRAREREKQLLRERELQREREQRESASNKERSGSVSSQASQAHTLASPTLDQAPRYSTQHMESSVTRLLVATKMLLESLTKWSMGQVTETQVSDIYVRLGNDFNTAKVAFGSYGIDMSDLHSVPDDLRACLERCLSEDASPAVLEVHLPRIREIIINLLQGLKVKQAAYKAYLVQRRSASRASITPSSSVSGAKARSSSTRIDRQGVSESSPAPSMRTDATEQDDSRQQDSRRSSSAGANTGSVKSGATSRASGRSAKQIMDDAKAAAVWPASEEAPSQSSSSDEMSRRSSRRGGGANGSLSQSPLKQSTTLPEPEQELPRLVTEYDMDADKRGVQPQAPSTPSPQERASKSGAAGTVRHVLVDPPLKRVSDDEEMEMISTPESKSIGRSPGMTSLSSKASGRFSKNSFKPPIEPGQGQDAVDADPSLKALKSRDALERRASKRFSAYTFTKMGVGQSFGQGFGSGSLGMTMFGGNGAASPAPDRGASTKRASSVRRVVRNPGETDDPRSGNSGGGLGTPRQADYFAHARTKSSKVPTADVAEAIDEVRTPTSSSAGGEALERVGSTDSYSQGSRGFMRSPRGNQALLAPGDGTGRIMSQAISSTDSLPYIDAQLAPPSESGAEEYEVPPVPPLPSPKERARLDAAQDRSSRGTLTNWSPGATASNQLHIYLQLGRQTRKATLELDEGAPGSSRGITVARLRMLFIDRFAYSPGKDDFPAIYIKDPVSRVSYELENLADVQEGCLLTLNIEPLDQVKQHLDLSLGAITRELRELKAAVSERDGRELAKRYSHSFASDALATPSIAAAAANVTPTKISDSQFQAAGQRVAQLKRANTRSIGAAGDDAPAQAGGSSSNPTASTGAKAAAELKAQYEELQSLRREFAIVRQIQGDFELEIKQLLGGVRQKVAKVREIASADLPAERNFIIAGKSRLDAGSQEVLTLVEDLQDTVDDLKLDVIQRGVKPKPAQVKQISDDIEKATKGLLELERYVQTVKPSWKKTWESELQNIVDEQEFLNHQEGLISDLRDDHAALQEVFANIQQVVKLRGGAKGGKYIPPVPEEGHGGLSTVMLEVRSQSVNHEKRLRALQAAEKQRQKELASRSDDFADELAGFVDGKALRKTGGHLEAERVRQKRDNATIKAMFGGGGSGGAPPPPSSNAFEKPKKFILGRNASSGSVGSAGGSGPAASSSGNVTSGGSGSPSTSNEASPELDSEG